MSGCNDRLLWALLISLLLAACSPPRARPGPERPRVMAAAAALLPAPGCAPGHSCKMRPAAADVAAHGCPGCNLRGVDYSGADLTNANLSRADLSGARLAGAKLDGANLDGANLAGASLAGASLKSTSRGSASLIGADLTRASLKGAQLDHTLFFHASFACTDLSHTDASTSHFGPTLMLDRQGGCKTSFASSKLGSELPSQSAALDLSGTTRSARPAAAVATSSASCGGVAITAAQIVYVASTGTDGAACGATSAAPCLTIAGGISSCTGACAVMVAYGTYALTSTLVMKSNVNLYGGCIFGTSGDASYVSLVTAPSGGAPALTADQITPAFTIQGFAFQGTDAVGDTSRASVTLRVNGSTLSLANVRITAGSGSQGAPGRDGTPGASGGNASGTTGGSSTCNVGGGNGGSGVTGSGWNTWSCSCSVPPNGGYGYQGGGSSGEWGSVGASTAICLPAGLPAASNPTAGKSGGPGGRGQCGSPGTAAALSYGTFSNGTWSAGPAGSDGGAGSGNGGGSGGGGGGFYYFTYSGWGGFGKPYNGSNGGGGGAGGCNGTSPSGGQQGGGSFGIVAISSTLSFTRTTVTGGSGGSGGAGGLGQAGGLPGLGAAGAHDGDSYYAFDGGKGGNGGSGGSSGGGAGGNGGPAVGIATRSSSAPTTGVTFYTGTGGGSEGGGKGGVTHDAKFQCSGPNGQDGLTGAAADTHSF